MEQNSTLLYSATKQTEGQQPVERLTWTLTEASQLLGISRSLAYTLASQNKLPGLIRLGGRLVVSRYQLQRYLDGEVSDG